MEIKSFDSFENLSKTVAEIIVHEINEKPNLLICPATGNSPKRAYQILVEFYQDKKINPSGIRMIKLDEWGDMELDHPDSCEMFLRKNLIEPLGLNPSQYIGYSGKDSEIEKSIHKVQDYLNHEGPIDLCILGIGANGHLAMNEPNHDLSPTIHRAILAPSTMEHAMIQNMGEKPKFGISLGMADLLNAKRIILIVQGKPKKEIAHKLLNPTINTQNPSSFLWLHPKIQVFLSPEILD